MPSLEPTRAVLGEVLAERLRQDEKWGEQNHLPEGYSTILGEEVGEVCRAILEYRFGNGPLHNIRLELIQVAAVAVAFVECLDRGKWKGEWKKDE